MWEQNFHGEGGRVLGNSERCLKPGIVEVGVGVIKESFQRHFKIRGSKDKNCSRRGIQRGHHLVPPPPKILFVH